VAEDGTLVATGTITVDDPDTGESSVQPQSNVAGSYGTFSILADGTWTYTLDNDDPAVQALAEGQTVTDSFTVTSFDGTATETIEITITGTNDVPVITGTTTGDVAEDGTLVATGTITVDDPDTGESSVQPQSNVAGSYGTFSILANGTWTYTLDNDDPAVQALAEGQTVTDSFTVTSFDGTATETIEITITGTNDVPVITVVGDDSDGAVLTTDEATPTSFLMAVNQGDPIYTTGQMATVTFFISRGEGQSPEEVTVEFLMGPSHVESLANMIAAINAADNGLSALKTGNAYQFSLFVDGGALGLDDISAVFTNPHVNEPNQFDLLVLQVIEGGTDAEGLSATGTLTVSDIDAVDVVNASVLELAVDGSGANSLPSSLDSDAFLAMMSVGTNPVIGSGDTTGSIVWTFDSGTEAFGFLDPNETLVLTYTIAATDSAGAVTEHDVTITIYGAGSDPQLLASSSDLEFSSALMFTALDEDSGGEVFVLTETDLTIDDLVIDYREGDIIDLTQLGFELATGQFTADAAGEYVTYDPAEGVLWIDMDGAGGEAEFEAVAEFVMPPPSILVRLSDGDTTADIQIA
jgi:VCBS repeat-containing protein